MKHVSRADLIVVGQTPPPFHGQALGIQAIAQYPFVQLRVALVRMAFSADMESVGHFRLAKVVHLFGLIVRILLARKRSGARILYYPPAGPGWTPVLRDFFLLPIVRPFFSQTVFHYRAAGLSAWLADRGRFVQWLAYKAYGRADLAILMSARLQDDSSGLLQAARTIVIPNGVADLAGARRANVENSAGHILFVGALRPEKGVDILIEALELLNQQGLSFRAEFVGKPISDAYMQELHDKVSETGLVSKVAFSGELTGNNLCDAYARAMIFCFPTQYASEAMPRVIIEAMQFGLPIVASDWRGIPDMFENGEQGLRVPVGDASRLAEALATFLQDSEKRVSMGLSARKRYESAFTIEQQMRAFEDAMIDLARSNHEI